MLKTKKLFIYLSVLLAGMLTVSGCESTIQDPVTPASESPPMNGQSPIVVIESLRGGEYVKGGTLYQVHLTITDPTLDSNSSTIEYSRDAGLTWTVMTSSTGQDGNDFATNSGEETVFNWSVPRELDCLASSQVSDGNNYKIRVLTRGRPDAFPTLEVTPGMFTVDSCAPIMLGMNFGHIDGDVSTGFSTISLPNITDTFSLSPIKDVCLKHFTTTAPTETDACWLNVNSLTGSSGETSLSNVSMPFFYGFTTMASMTTTLWARDYAHNQSELTLVASSPVGVTNTDITDVYTRTCAGANCTGKTITGGAVSSHVVVNSVTVMNKSDGPAAPTLLDPQMFVVDSAGIVYIRDKVRGIVKVNPITGTQTVIVPQTGTIADGLLAIASVKKPMRIALDREENLIIFDYDRIRRINLNEAPGSQTIETIVGGGSDTSGTVTTATNLQIDYHDNLLWYGTFQVLPNNWIVFNSEDPLKELDNSVLPDETDRFRLRVYRPDRDIKIISIKLSGTGVSGDSGQAVDTLWPYGGMGVTYDTTNKDISYIYARLCDDDTSCAFQTMSVFGEDGVAVSAAALNFIVPSYFSNNNLFVSRTGNLYSMNRLEGYIRRYDGSSWSTQVGRGFQNFASLCANGTGKTACELDLWDTFVGANERIYFIDSGVVRFVDSYGKVHSYVTLTP